jgi:hypothetical protein
MLKNMVRLWVVDAGAKARVFTQNAVELALPGRQRCPLGVTPQAARENQ